MSASDSVPPRRTAPAAPAADPAFLTRYGPWAVVTGASSGIGREVAIALAERGMHLVLVGRSAEALERLAAEARDRHRVGARSLVLDLAREEAPGALASATADLDVGLLVAAAGFGSSGRFLDAPLADERDMLHVNVRAVLELTHHFGRRFRAQGRGGIVLLSSVLAFQGAPWSAHYAATKAYVQALAEALHAELAPSGVDVLASAPGPVATGFAARARLRMGLTLGPRRVARVTLAALGRGATVRPGWLSKLLGWSLATLPRWARVRVMGAIMRGMTDDSAARPAAHGAPAR